MSGVSSNFNSRLLMHVTLDGVSEYPSYCEGTTLDTSWLKPGRFKKNKKQNETASHAWAGKPSHPPPGPRESPTAQVHREAGQPSLLAANLFPGASSTRSWRHRCALPRLLSSWAMEAEDEWWWGRALLLALALALARTPGLGLVI